MSMLEISARDGGEREKAVVGPRGCSSSVPTSSARWQQVAALIEVGALSKRHLHPVHLYEEIFVLLVVAEGHCACSR